MPPSKFPLPPPLEIPDEFNGISAQSETSPTGSVIVKPRELIAVPEVAFRTVSFSDGTYETRPVPIEETDYKGLRSNGHAGNGTTPINPNGSIDENPIDVEVTEEIEENAVKLREDIRDLQAHAQHSFQEKVKETLRSYLPEHIFEKDPRVKQDLQNDTTPTLLDLEVTRAKAFAELSTYLSYIRSTQKKRDFLSTYHDLEEQFLKLEVKTKMEQLAKMYPLIDEHGQPATFTQEQQDRKKFFGSKKDWSGPKSAVHRLGPMFPRKQNQTSTAALVV